MITQEIGKLRAEITAVNLQLRRIGHKSHAKTKRNKLRKLRRFLYRKLHANELALSEIGFGIDNFSESVVSCSKHQSRYLRVNSNYYSDRNYLIAINKSGLSYVWKTKYSQITKNDLSMMLSKLHVMHGEFECYTDNRHRYIATLSKQFTQHTERMISRIKKPIYRMLKDNKCESIEQLDSLYIQQFQRLNIQPLNF